MWEWYGWTWAAAMEAAKPFLVGMRAASTLYLLSVEMSHFIKDLQK